MIVLLKRGQVTIFVIIGIGIVMLVLGFLFISNNQQNDNENKQSSFSDDTVKEDLLDCFTLVYSDSLNLIGVQGGYFEFTGDQLDTIYGFVPYYYDKGNVVLLSKEELENQISNAVDNAIDSCFKGSYSGAIDVSFGSHTTSVRVEENYVLFTTDVVASVSEEGTIRDIDFGSELISIDSNIYYMFILSQFITNYVKDNNEALCLSCLDQFAQVTNIDVDVIDMQTDENDFLIIMTDNNIDYSPKLFEIMHRYNRREIVVPQYE